MAQVPWETVEKVGPIPGLLCPPVGWLRLPCQQEPCSAQTWGGGGRGVVTASLWQWLTLMVTLTLGFISIIMHLLFTPLLPNI